MVMEAPPSPDSVGREFVRQYYTLLNKAPTHLHRFYNNQSSFVHGGLDPPHRETSPMIGQKEIHQKIQQLNFQDCHAKIAQVDAQATLGNGVVVQVTGELSNAGQPMRRFTQTFVLAAQSPKKYYVHNDIFRYQDEIISDEECENETRTDDEDEINMDRSGVNEMPPINQPIPYYAPNNAPIPANIPTVPHHHVPQPAPHVIPQAMPTVNGNVHPEDLNVMSASNVPQHLPASTPMNSAPVSGLQSSQFVLEVGSAPVQIDSPPALEEIPPIVEDRNTEVIDTYNESHVNNEGAEVIEPVSNEPKTYATLLKSGGGMGYSGATQSVPAFVPQKSLSPPPGNRFDSREMSSGPNNQQRNRMENNRNNQRNNQQPRIPRQDSRPPPRNNSNEDGNNYDERRRSQSNYSESSQLFLGHLPHTATESELRDIFSQYGPILELRVHSKPPLKPGQSAGRAPLNYGFITYENAAGVQTCLQAMPIYYPMNDKNGTVLNVEEKKVKDRMSFGGGNGGRTGMDNNMGNRPRDNGPRRGGMSGQSRGGSGGGSLGTGPSGNRQNNFNRGPPSRGGGGGGGGQNNSYRR